MKDHVIQIQIVKHTLKHIAVISELPSEKIYAPSKPTMIVGKLNIARSIHMCFIPLPLIQTVMVHGFVQELVTFTFPNCQGYHEGNIGVCIFCKSL